MLIYAKYNLKCLSDLYPELFLCCKLCINILTLASFVSSDNVNTMVTYRKRAHFKL